MVTAVMSDSEATPRRTRATKSRARICASRVMSQAAFQHSTRASGSWMVSMPSTRLASERSSSRILV
jgi:hypothetical protein